MNAIGNTIEAPVTKALYLNEEVHARAVEQLEVELSAREGLLSPRVAAVELMHEFKLIASAVSPRDPSVQDDLVQEMCLGVLMCREAHAPSYYIWLANWRARGFSAVVADAYEETAQTEASKR